MNLRRVAINTGGGDAPGLNAVIRAAVLAGANRGWEMVGIRQGYNGLLDDKPNGLIELTRDRVRGITHLGGTILGTTNRGNPTKWPLEQADGTIIEVDRCQEIIQSLAKHGIDALIAVGGDGSLAIAQHLHEVGLPVVGVPKTIDNDLAATTVTFGFATAVETATDAIGKLHSTAESHERVMVVEVMGRHAGWIALYSGLAGTADVILVPEIPYSLDRVCEKIERRYAAGRNFAIVVVAEGARPKDEGASFIESAGPGTAARYGGIADKLELQIAEMTGRETRSLVLGHLQRGGQPTARDRVLAQRFGSAAIELVAEKHFGCMVALDPPDVKAVPLADAVRELKLVPTDGDVVRTARAVGICLGD